MSEIQSILNDVKALDAALHELNYAALGYKHFIDNLSGMHSTELLASLGYLLVSLEGWFESQPDVDVFYMHAEDIKSSMLRIEDRMQLEIMAHIDTDKTGDRLVSAISATSALLTHEIIKNYVIGLELFDTLLRRLGVDNQTIEASCDGILNNLKSNSKEASGILSQLTKTNSTIEQQRVKLFAQMDKAAESVTAAATKHIGSTIAAGYRLSAKKENKLADWFRYGSIGCFVASASIILFGFWNNTAVPRSFVELIYRAGPILFFTIPAFYLARESNAHRAVQRKFQHLSLNLPIGIKYIRGLDETSRHLIEAEFAKHLLMYSENSMASVTQGGFVGNNDDLSLRTILSELKAVVEKIPKP